MEQNIALELCLLLQTKFGYNFKKVSGLKGVAAGPVVYEYYLYRTGFLENFIPSAPEVYIDGKRIFSPDDLNRFTRGENHEEKDTRYYYQEIIDSYYSINLEQMVLFDKEIYCTPEFDRLLQTKQIEVVSHFGSECAAALRLLQCRDRYTGKLFVNIDSELKKIETLNAEIPCDASYLPVAKRYAEEIGKYFSIKYKNETLTLLNKFNSYEKSIPYKKSDKVSYDSYVFTFWDLIYGGAKKLVKYNYDLLRKYGLNTLFTKAAIENYKTQLKEEDLKLPGKTTNYYSLNILRDKDDISKTLENFLYLQLLLNDYGNDIFTFVSICQGISKNAEHLFENIWKEIEKERLNVNIQRDSMFLNKPLYFSEFNSEGIEIKELVTGKELKEEGNLMKHCVGGIGYQNAVKNGYCRIFSMKSQSSRSTLELSSTFAIRQNKSFQNTKPSEELILMGKKFANFLSTREKNEMEILLLKKKYGLM